MNKASNKKAGLISSSYSKKDQKVPEASEEEGEISEASDKIQYDFDRLPEWPGFNVEFPENFRDESRKFNAPKMRDDQVTAQSQNNTMK